MRSLVIFWYQQIYQSATVPSQKGHGACPCQTLPGLNYPFLICHAWANSLSAAHHFCFASLAYCSLARKVPQGFFWWNLSWAHCTLSCGQSSFESPFCMLGMLASPSLGGFLVSPRASGTYQERSFNAILRDTLSVLGPVGTASSFLFGKVFGEGVSSLGELGAPLPSFLTAPPVRPLGHIWALLIVHGSGLVPCHLLLQNSFLAPKFQPELHTEALIVCCPKPLKHGEGLMVLMVTLY